MRLFHWILGPDGRLRDKVSVKGGCIEGLVWEGAKHLWVKRARVMIPAGAERWEEGPETMGGQGEVDED